MITILATVLVSSLFCALGQIFLKIGSNRIPLPASTRPKAQLAHIRAALCQPWIWAGLGAMGLGLMAWLCAMAQGDLSLVYPIGSLYYLFVLVFARVFLKEKIDRMKIAGTFFIFLGILLIIRS